MKKVINLIFFGMFFSGQLMAFSLFSSQVIPEVKEKDGFVEIISDLETSENVRKHIDNKHITEYQLYEALKMAAEYTLNKNAQYFVILNNGINNFEGFPINNYEDLKNYCFSLKKENTKFYFSKNYEKCENLRSLGSPKSFSLKIKIVDEKISKEIYTWDAKQVLAELK